MIGNKKSLFNATYRVKANFRKVAGLIEEAPVRVGARARKFDIANLDGILAPNLRSDPPQLPGPNPRDAVQELFTIDEPIGLRVRSH